MEAGHVHLIKMWIIIIIHIIEQTCVFIPHKKRKVCDKKYELEMYLIQIKLN